jgi:hypothetical protein
LDLPSKSNKKYSGHQADRAHDQVNNSAHFGAIYWGNHGANLARAERHARACDLGHLAENRGGPGVEPSF